jgi:hypothetical protein
MKLPVLLYAFSIALFRVSRVAGTATGMMMQPNRGAAGKEQPVGY